MALVEKEMRHYDSDSTDDHVSMNLAYPCREPNKHAPFPAPRPTAMPSEHRIRTGSSPPRPIRTIPPLPRVPATLPITRKPVGLGLVLPPVVKSKRKTILERIDGWWDLGLLERRQTLLGKHR